MAMPVPMKQIIQKDPREELQKRIQDAPIDHADAVLSAYDLLQRLHDTGTLDVLRGALGAGDALVEHVVSLLTAPESVNALRNLILMGKVLGSINPDVLHAVVEGIPQATAQVPGVKPPSLFALGRRIASPDARRGLSAAITVMEVLGRGLAKEA
jgi:uncharacterized protein YjgD (DUF1641 family)